MDSGQPSAPAPRPALLRPAPLGPAPPQTRSVRRRSLDFSHPAAECDEPGPGGGLLRKPKAPCGGSERGFGCAPGTMRRSIRRAPSRKRKLEGRAKGGRESAAVNSFYLAALLHSVWTFLKLREMVRSGSRPGQVRSADLRRPLSGWRGTEVVLGPGEVESPLWKNKKSAAALKNATGDEAEGGCAYLILTP